MRTLLVLLATLFGSAAQAAGTLVYISHYIDVINATSVRDVSLEIENGKIKTISSGFRAPAAGEQLIDLRGLTVLPGFIDLHVHFQGEMSPAAYSEGFFMNPSDTVLRGSTYARKTLEAGFTTVRELGANHGTNVSLRNAINKGWVVGPRMLVAGKGIGSTGGHADPTNGLNEELRADPGPDMGIINGADDARKAVRQRYKEGADVIKIMATGGVLSLAKSGQNPQLTDEELNAIMDAAKDYNFTVAVHAHGKDGMLRAVKAGVTTVEHGTFMDDEVIREMKKRGTWYVPTISAGVFVSDKAKQDGFFPAIVKPKAEHIGAQIRKTFSYAYKAGVNIALGTDAGVSSHGENAKEFIYMVEGGMPAMAALQAGTINAAKALRMENELGSIAVGKYADLVALKTDPSSDINAVMNVQFVMKEGVVYKSK